MKQLETSEESYAAAFREIGTLRRVLMGNLFSHDGWRFVG
jgi:hypothetical protein